MVAEGVRTSVALCELAREREAAAVRLIAAAKAVGAPEEQPASRLRETYA